MITGLNNVNSWTVNAECGETVPLSVTATSSSVTFNLKASALNTDCIITNAGTKTAFFGFGVGSVTAQVPGTNGTLNATPILAGAILTIQKNHSAFNADTCAAICGGSDSTTLYFTSIQGS